MANTKLNGLSDNLKALDEAVEALQNENLPIEQAIEVYSQAIKLAAKTKDQIDNLKQVVVEAKQKANDVLADSNNQEDPQEPF